MGAIITVNICYLLCILVLNRFVGNLYVNTIGSSLIELFSNSISAFIILKGYDLKKTLIIIYAIMALTYFTCLFIDISE